LAAFLFIMPRAGKGDSYEMDYSFARACGSRGCPWLITRFIDNEAEFLFVPASQIDKVVKETGAIPFRCARCGTRHGSDGRCSFESIILNMD